MTETTRETARKISEPVAAFLCALLGASLVVFFVGLFSHQLLASAVVVAAWLGAIMYGERHGL